MDHAVSLVQAYLQLNGYFTSAEYPIVETSGREVRTITDIDILAFRFPSNDNGGGPDSPHRRQLGGTSLRTETDPGLAVPPDHIDMVIGEVKEGKVGINTGSRSEAVLETVLERFGHAGEEADRLITGLLAHGAVVTPRGYQVRIIAFGAFPPGSEVPPCRIISLGHVLQFLQGYVREHWDVLKRCQFKDPAFGFLMTLEKARRGSAGRRGRHGVEVVRADGVRPSQRKPPAKRQR